MNWTSKFICIFISLTSISLILRMGHTNVKYFSSVQDSIKEIYHDRLVVKGLIYELTSLLHKKEIAYLVQNKKFFFNENDKINERIDNKITLFRATKLTDLEAESLGNFSRGIRDLQSSEKKNTLKNIDRFLKSESNGYMNKIDLLQGDLKVLSEIQLSEGKLKLNISRDAVENMRFYESVEKYSIIFLGILALIILLLPARRKLNS